MRRLIHPDDRSRYDAHVRSCERSRGAGEGEWRIRRRKGGYVWIGHACQPVFDDKGVYLGIRGSNRDITDRKRAELALQAAEVQLSRRVRDRTAKLRASNRTLAESEARFRQMAESVGEVFWLADANLGRMLYVSPAFEAIWGRPCLDLYRDPQLWMSCIHPDDRDLVHTAFLDNRRHKAPLQAEYRIVRPDGAVRWIADSGNRVRDNAGRVYRIAGVARDITERKKIEQALAQSERALRAIMGCNEALLRSTSEQELYQRVCDIIVETGGYRMAWIGLAEDAPSRRVIPVAEAGGGKSYLEKAGVVWSDTRRGRGPTGTAIRTGQPNACCNMTKDPRMAPWALQARQHGFGATLALPMIADGKRLGALTIYAAEPRSFDHDEVQMLLQLANDVAFGVTALRTRAARARLERELLDISEREQRRIGQDLHDGLGQLIASARLTCSAVAQRLTRDRHNAAESTRRVEFELTRALDETRRIARGLHPVKPMGEALMSALHELAVGLRRMSHIPCHFICRRPVLLADSSVATHLYRIAQEATNNALRHGEPKHIRITLARVDGHIQLRIVDDGSGFRVDPVAGRGLGLEIMRHRSSVIGARLDVSSQPGRGTSIVCTLPSSPVHAGDQTQRKKEKSA